MIPPEALGVRITKTEKEAETLLEQVEKIEYKPLISQTSGTIQFSIHVFSLSLAHSFFFLFPLLVNCLFTEILAKLATAQKDLKKAAKFYTMACDNGANTMGQVHFCLSLVSTLLSALPETSQGFFLIFLVLFCSKKTT